MLLLSSFILPLTLAYQYLPEDPMVDPRLGLGARLSPRPQIEAVPYHVLVFYSNLYCSGTVIGSKAVVTAASCLTKPGVQVSVKTGTDTIADEGEIIAVKEIKIHEFYKYRSELDNDIALLFLERPVTFSKKVQKLILVESDIALREGSPIVVSGWGCTNTSPARARHLMWSSMFVLEKEECYAIFGGLITTSMFCAKYKLVNNHPVRLSDNGGPAVFKEMLVGIASFGATHPDDPVIAIFTNVSYFYRWIKVNTYRFLRKYCIQENNMDDDYQYYMSVGEG